MALPADRDREDSFPAGSARTPRGARSGWLSVEGLHAAATVLPRAAVTLAALDLVRRDGAAIHRGLPVEHQPVSPSVLMPSPGPRAPGL